MRVLLVSHLFPPEHSAGTEVYTAELGARLAARGHEVVVFTTDKNVGREDLSVREREHEGLRVVELTNNLYLDDFRETWERPTIARRFGQWIERLQPDVVHFQHLLYLSVGCLEQVSRRNLALLFTLHDFWLECPRLGQLVHADGSLCHTVDHARCGTCLPSFAWGQSHAQRRVGRAIAWLHATSGIDLGPLARGAARRLRGRARGGFREPPVDEALHYARLAGERTWELRRRVLTSVDRFLAPSRYLRGRLLDWGVAPERVHYLPTGIDPGAFQPRERARSDRLRVAFVGSLVPLKGAHVLLEAWEQLDPADRALGELELRGPDEHAPAYVRGLRERAGRVGAVMGGALEREAVAELLARTDLLVVPSVWFENRPLIVLEALSSGVPLLVSDLGGLAELVEPGRHGWRFEAADAGALAERLRAVLRDRSLLAALDPASATQPSWDELADAVLDHYRAVRAVKEGA